MNQARSLCNPEMVKIEIVSPDGTRRSDHAILHQQLGCSLVLTMDAPPPLNTVVTVESHDKLFIGEIVGRERASGSSECVRVRVSEILNGLQNLMRLRNTLLSSEPIRNNQTASFAQ